MVIRVLLMWLTGRCYVVVVWLLGYCDWFPGCCYLITRVLFMWLLRCYVVVTLLLCGC